MKKDIIKKYKSIDAANHRIKQLEAELKKYKGKELAPRKGFIKKISDLFSSKKKYKNFYEQTLSFKDYIICDLPNYNKPIFHDTLKGFEEFSRLKGYISYLSIDSSLDDKIAFKFTCPNFYEKEDKFSITYKIKNDLSDYLSRVINNDGIDDMPILTNKIKHFQYSTIIKNRMVLIKHQYDTDKILFETERAKPDEKLKKLSKKLTEKINELNTKETNYKNEINSIQEKYISIINEKDDEKEALKVDLIKKENELILKETEVKEQTAEYELKLSDLNTQNQMLHNENAMKDNLIDHMKDIFCETLAKVGKTNFTQICNSGVGISQDKYTSIASSNVAQGKSIDLKSNNSEAIYDDLKIQNVLDAFRDAKESISNLDIEGRKKDELLETANKIENEVVKKNEANIGRIKLWLERIKLSLENLKIGAETIEKIAKIFEFF